MFLITFMVLLWLKNIKGFESDSKTVDVSMIDGCLGGWWSGSGANFSLFPLTTLFSSFVSRGPAAALYPLLFDPVKDSASSEMSQYLTVCVSMIKVWGYHTRVGFWVQFWLKLFTDFEDPEFSSCWKFRGQSGCRTASFMKLRLLGVCVGELSHMT